VIDFWVIISIKAQNDNETRLEFLFLQKYIKMEVGEGRTKKNFENVSTQRDQSTKALTSKNSLGNH